MWCATTKDSVWRVYTKSTEAMGSWKKSEKGKGTEKGSGKSGNRMKKKTKTTEKWTMRSWRWNLVGGVLSPPGW